MNLEHFSLTAQLLNFLKISLWEYLNCKSNYHVKFQVFNSNCVTEIAILGRFFVLAPIMHFKSFR